MSSTWAFSIGGISLSNFEVPEEFTIGHEAKLIVHEYLSSTGIATKKVNSMGVFPVPTSWKGILFTGTAFDRHTALDKLCIAQNYVHWIYGPYDYTVVIRKYEGKVKHQQEIEYSIELEILSEKTGNTSQNSPAASFDQATQAALNQTSSALNDLSLYDAADDADDASSEGGVLLEEYNTLTTLIASLNPISTQGYATITSLIGDCDAFDATLGDYVSDLAENAVIEKDLAALNASLIALQGFGLFVGGLQQLVGGGPAQTIQGFTGSVWVLAAQYYPAADLWKAVDTIAQANNLTSYQVDTAMDLILPPIFS